ncbi:phage tail protein [Massilicoli timonensis]|uniref:phage tail protein n=1 Tax=Massilicoli timonensis TaxID=2015901 RepID=UPI000C84E64E|nr:phage tail protein [Massilicoli timonensis]
MKLLLKYGDTTLFDSETDEYKATEINLTEQVNTTNTLVFVLPTLNPNKDIPQELIPGIALYEDDVLVFEGRVLYTDDDIIGNRTFTCEGSLAYLLDSIVRPNTTQDTTISEYLSNLIDQHNLQVEESKRFQLGTVTVSNSTDNVYQIDNDYSNTLSVIQDKLVNRLGGYLRVRMLNGVRYLDYLESYDSLSNQTIEFQKNILDLSNHISSENVITALIPLGAKDDTTELPLTIESVNGGKDYIFDQTAVNLFGWIYGTQTWDDVTLPQNLLTKGQAALQANIENSVSISITAFDMSLVDADIDKIYLGDSVKVISTPHDLDKYFIVKKREKKYMNPENSSITLDTVIERNTDKVSSTDKTLQEAVNVTIPGQIQQMIDYQTQLILGGKGGYVVFGMNEQNQPEEIYILDKPTVNDAVNIIRMNKNGIGFSNSGINGPYTSAWTIDGKFNADFISAGTLTGILIKGTTIEGGFIRGSAITTDQDLTVGNNIYMNAQNETATKQIYMSNTGRIRFTKQTDGNSVEMISSSGANYANLSTIAGEYSIIVFNLKDSKGTLNIQFSTSGIIFDTDLTCLKNLNVLGTKNRLVKTQNYGNRLMNAIESTYAVFEDFGTAITDEKGYCSIELDPIFLETVNTDYPYQCFLTPLSDDLSARINISYKGKTAFSVIGTPNTVFDWRIVARQRGYENTRMEVQE